MATIPQSIINTILADVNAIVADLQQLVASYRLLVGAAEEIHRTPSVPPDIFKRAVDRFDRAGSLIDIIIDLLCCKISYSSDFLSVTCAPVDLYRLLQNRTDFMDTPHHTAEQILQLELLRRTLEMACPPPKTPCPPSPPACNPPADGVSQPITTKVPPHQLESEVKDDLFVETDKDLFTEVNEDIS